MVLNQKLVQLAGEFRDQNRYLPSHKNIEEQIVPGTCILPLYVQNDKHAQGAYTCVHLETNGVHLKTPPLYNFLLIYSVQAALEHRFNEGFLKFTVTPTSSIKNEKKTYAFLESKGFDTLKLAPEQHLINGIPVLLTKRIDARNLGNLIEQDQLTSQEIYSAYTTAGCQMRKLHELGVIWGDAKPGNILIEGGREFIFDFGPVANRKLPTISLEAKDVQTFFYEMMIARKRVNVTDAIAAFNEGYKPTTGHMSEVSRSVTRQKKKYLDTNKTGFASLYLKRFHKCSINEFLEIEKTLARK